MAKITSNQIRTLHDLTAALPNDETMRIRLLSVSGGVVLVWNGGEFTVEPNGDWRLKDRKTQKIVKRGLYKKG